MNQYFYIREQTIYSEEQNACINSIEQAHIHLKESILFLRGNDGATKFVQNLKNPKLENLQCFWSNKFINHNLILYY